MKSKNQLGMGMLIIIFCVASMLVGCSFSSRLMSEIGLLSKLGYDDASVYHEFYDVLVPNRLKVDKKQSCIFQISEFFVGVLTLRGKICSTELIDFFEKNMNNDNWNIVNSFKSRRSIMLFRKVNRWCIICINDEGKNACVEVWILPSESGLLKLKEVVTENQANK